MHNKVLTGVVFLVFTSLAWASNEPWKEKPYQQWDKADLAIILTNSPWVKKVVVDVNWKPDPSSAVRSSMPESDPTASLRGSDKGGMPDSAPPDRSMDTPASSASAPTQAVFYIRWYSSRVIREALTRQAVINGQVSEADGEKLLSAPVADYEITIFGPDMTPFQNLTEDQLKSASYLEGKQSKQKVGPASVRLNKNPHSRTINLVFVFPKKTDSGADVASAQEKGLEFVCKLKGLDLRNTFDTHKMVDEKGVDF